MCIGMNKLYDDPNRMRHSVHEFYIKSPQQMARLFADIPEAIQHTQEIVQKCQLELHLGNPTPPNFKFTKEYAASDGLNINHSDDEHSVPKDKFLSAADKNDAEYFIYRCKKGLEKRLRYIPQERHEEYRRRLEFEMDVINSMKFPGYMLIVWDFVKVAKEKGIAVGPGRGSAAGSLVAYSLEITDIDPLKYDLLFERFLNPERVSMPDIDMDFMQARRGEVIDYVVEKYGRNQVAQIITFGSLLAKGVIRDVARVLDMPLSKADKMAKLIPDELGITLNGKKKDIVWHEINEDDASVYSSIREGNTVGMFQIESSGMQDLNKRLMPDSFEDLIAVLALYRPGPMESGMLDSFIERKHGREKIE